MCTHCSRSARIVGRRPQQGDGVQPPSSFLPELLIDFITSLDGDDKAGPAGGASGAGVSRVVGNPSRRLTTRS